MMQLSYTKSPHLQSKIDEIENLHRDLLLTQVSWRDLQNLQWQTSVDRLFHLLQLEDIPVHKNSLEGALSSDKRGNENPSYKFSRSLYRAYLDMFYNWQLEKRDIEVSDIFELIDPISEFKIVSLGVLPTTLVYLQTNPDHPLIQGALSEAAALQSDINGTHIGIFASMMRSLILYKHGYDFRRIVTLSTYFHQNKSTYIQFKTDFTKNTNATLWIEFVLDGYVEVLRSRLASLESLTYHTPTRIQHISGRQVRILSMLEKPQSTITNRDIQRICKVSPMTAARDLANLTGLGLILSVGKGRSTYYTKGS